MSIQAVAAVLECSVDEVAAKMLLVCIANAHNTKDGMCCPSIDRLASESGMSRSSVKRWLKWLEERHWIAVSKSHDATGRQRAHEYRLTLEEGSNLNPSPQDVEEESELNPREANGELEEGATGEPPLKEPEERTFSPQPPSGGPRFDDVWKGWPTEHQGNRDNAAASWDKLTGAEKALAVAHAAVTVKTFAARGERVPALVMYFRHKLFAEFDGAPEIDEHGFFVIRPGRPEWSEWLGWIRRTFGEKAVENTVKAGVWQPKSRWPEGRETKVAA